MTVQEKMESLCKTFGYTPSENLPKVAKVKERFFSADEWYRCPCDRDNPDRFCIGRVCRQDIEEKGICHCGCYKKAE